MNAEYRTCNRNNKGIYSCFYESKKSLGGSMYRGTCRLKKNKKQKMGWTA